jgi:hypothetical protein
VNKLVVSMSIRAAWDLLWALTEPPLVVIDLTKNRRKAVSSPYAWRLDIDAISIPNTIMFGPRPRSPTGCPHTFRLPELNLPIHTANRQPRSFSRIRCGRPCAS